MQINKVCRACLGLDDEMIDMSENDIYRKFLLFSNLNAEDEIPNISLNLCQSCEQKLNISFDFKEHCRKSHEILLKYVTNTREPLTEAIDDDLQQNCENNEVKLEATDSDLLSEVIVDTNAKKTLQLELFPQHQVIEAIKELDQKRYKSYNCIRCNYIGSNLRSLSAHITRMHKDVKTRWCCLCNSIFDNLTDHKTQSHIDKCKFCGKKFHKKSHLFEHLHFHSDVKLFQCTYCEKSFNGRSSLKQHLRNHTNEKPYKCSLCDMSFVRLCLLKYHVKVHKSDTAVKLLSEARQNFCVQCDKKVNSLVAHNKKVHTTRDDDDDAEGNYLCSVCKKSFNTSVELSQHARTHTIKCRYCNMKFKRHDHLIEHESIHTDEKPYICQVCGKRFVQRSSLMGHLTLHNIDTKKSCNVCDKKFSNLNHFNEHLRTHNAESNLRPWKCTGCDKSFREKIVLKRHMWIHTGENPYKCNQCSYSCRYSPSLIKHMKYHTTDKPDKPHICLMCNSNFPTNALLVNHVKRHNVNFLEV